MFNPRPTAASPGSERLLGFWLAVMFVALVAAFFYLPLMLFLGVVVIFILLGIFVRLGRLGRR